MLQKCRTSPTSTECAWRPLHRDFITETVCAETIPHDAFITEYAPQLTYAALIELSGKRGPKSCRERNVLNILSLLPKMHPIPTTPNIVDRSQGIYRGGLRRDGAMCTLASSSLLWSFADARLLSQPEIATLMGHDTSSLQVDGVTDKQFRTLLGLSIHVGTAGMMAAVLLASLGCDVP